MWERHTKFFFNLFNHFRYNLISQLKKNSTYHLHKFHPISISKCADANYFKEQLFAINILKHVLANVPNTVEYKHLAITQCMLKHDEDGAGKWSCSRLPLKQLWDQRTLCFECRLQYWYSELFSGVIISMVVQQNRGYLSKTFVRCLKTMRNYKAKLLYII